MRRLLVLIAVTVNSLAVSLGPEAAQPPKVARIGYLTGTSISIASARMEAFRQGLRQLGYTEGKNVIIEWRGAEGRSDRLTALATELVRLRMDVIVTTGSSATRAAKQTTVTIPIVMANDSDPVGNGFVVSVARPGGNITGLSTFAPELSGKRVELLKEILPRLSRIAVFGTSTSLDNAQSLREVEGAADAFGVKLQYMDVLGVKDIATAFRAAGQARADAVLMIVLGTVALPRRAEIAELAIKSRLPVIYEREIYIAAGGLVSYGVNRNDLDRRAAIYVDKILKGANPADLPVQQPTKFELVINLKTAKQIGLTIPPNVLARADRVIK